jgi:hypothetical protein
MNQLEKRIGLTPTILTIQAVLYLRKHSDTTDDREHTYIKFAKHTSISAKMMSLIKAIALSITFHALAVASFQASLPSTATMASRRDASLVLKSTAAGEAASSSSYLYKPDERDAHYNGNIAQYLVDLHNEKATFNFCGGMMFQLVLSEKLKAHLEGVAAASSSQEQPVVFDATHPRMERISGYKLDADADNLRVFHGREIRKVPDATGGMGFVLQLSHSDEDDPEGWTSAEVEGYDGWAHDSGRVWRKGDRLESEGFSDFRSRFGPNSFALHHRFYLHYDNGNSMWLSAEDGCEGTPAPAGNDGVVNRIAALMGLGA